jgi:5'-nucleotidase
VSARPRILLTNDDGVRSAGLRSCFEELSRVGDVTVVAPVDQRSGTSHMITLETPLRAHRLVDLPGWMVDFTPVDCVKLALRQLLPAPPDLVVSGINHGWNTGHLVHYSGTVAAGKEALLNGVPAVATSLCCWDRPGDFGPAARATRQVVEALLASPIPRGLLLNVNVPDVPEGQLKGFRWARQCTRPLVDTYERREDPRHRSYYWLTGALQGLVGQVADDDVSVVQAGFVALTPLQVDWTERDVLARGQSGELLGGLGSA